MPEIDTEIRNVQNSAFGAALLAAFVIGYYSGDERKRGAPLPYLFLVLPLILRADIYRIIAGTTPGLRHMAEKFFSSEHAATDLLLSVRANAARLRPLTRQSFAILLHAGLASLDPETGRVVPRKTERFSERSDKPDESKVAEKLGKWLAQLSPVEVGSILKVTF